LAASDRNPHQSPAKSHYPDFSKLCFNNFKTHALIK
jgi:hypothetical protein